MNLWSQRFNKAIRLTYHAKARMQERQISEALLLDLIEHGDTKFKDEKHVWFFKNYAERADNLVCAATVIDEAIIVKTVMINWHLEQ
jgi:hypothetical protein